jgi:hypothetical protein
MGANPDSTTHALPTMRWAQRRARSGGLPPKAVASRLPPSDSLRGLSISGVRSLVTVVHRLLDVSYRYAVGVRACRRGTVVLFDRYVYDAAIDGRLARASWPERVFVWLTEQLFPAPDLLLVLDAPGEALYARKGEHSLARLDRLGAAYRALAARVPGATLIDATQPADQVLQAAATAINHRLGDGTR